MNIYFVFEGKTEPIIFKEWFKRLLPTYSEVNNFDEVKENNFHYESDMGVPNCYNIVANAIQEINEYPHYNYLVLFIDADRSTVSEKIIEANEAISKALANKEHKSLPYNCQLKIIVQKVCIETWFLGNRKFFISNPTSPLLRDYIAYYNASIDNPEDMAKEFIQNEENSNSLFGYNTRALFHESYLREIFKEHNSTRTSRNSAPSRHLIYRKSKPMEVQEPHFLEQLIIRIASNPEHLSSFQGFLEFINELSQPDASLSISSVIE
jgi:hypothetical protein